MLWPLPICLAVPRQRQSLRLIRVTDGGTELYVSGRCLTRRCHGMGQYKALAESTVRYFTSPYHDDRIHDSRPISSLGIIKLVFYICFIFIIVNWNIPKWFATAFYFYNRTTSIHQTKQNRTSIQNKSAERLLKYHTFPSDPYMCHWNMFSVVQITAYQLSVLSPYMNQYCLIVLLFIKPQWINFKKI